jgi:hypothetical protein
MPLQSSSFQTALTANILDGQVTAMDVLDPTEYNDKTSQLEVDDEFDVQLAWRLTGTATPDVGGSWVVSLYSDDMDGTGTMTGLIAGPAIIPITGDISPLTFRHTFRIAPPKVKEGLYKLTATISHSPTGDPANLSEMSGHAESTPVTIQKTGVESN